MKQWKSIQYSLTMYLNTRYLQINCFGCFLWWHCFRKKFREYGAVLNNYRVLKAHKLFWTEAAVEGGCWWPVVAVTGDCWRRQMVAIGGCRWQLLGVFFFVWKMFGKRFRWRNGAQGGEKVKTGDKWPIFLECLFYSEMVTPIKAKVA